VSCRLIQNGVADWISPGPNETLVIFNRLAKAWHNWGAIEIYVDGEYALELNNKQTGRVLLPQGNHSIQARSAVTGLYSETVNITAGADTITYIADIGGEGGGRKNPDLTPPSLALQEQMDAE
jgi:hypothetical protein